MNKKLTFTDNAKLPPYASEFIESEPEKALVKDKFESIAVIAHRGSHRTAPENTIQAFEAAIKGGSHGFECDIRFSRDGQPVIFHDRTLLRTFGLPIPIKLLNWKDIQNLSSKRGRPIPHLQEVLELLQQHSIRCFLDLKVTSSDKIARIIDRVIRMNTLEKITFVISSRQYKNTKSLFFPKLQSGVMIRFRYPFLRTRSHLQDLREEQIALFTLPSFFKFDRLFHLNRFSNAIYLAKSHGLRVTAGLANNKVITRYLLDMPIEGIWTDRLNLIPDGLKKPVG